MKLYYGSEQIVEMPVHGQGNSSNDYGLGFYLTPDYEAARLWAARYPNGGQVMTYEVGLEGLLRLDMDGATSKDILDWISLLVAHRFSQDDFESNRTNIEWLLKHHSVKVSDYDVVVGYRADDSYFAYSLDFVRNGLSLEALSKAMKLGKLGKQIVLISHKAFQRVKLIKHDSVSHSDEYSIMRKKVLGDYEEIKKNDDIRNTFLRDVMRKEGL